MNRLVRTVCLVNTDKGWGGAGRGGIFILPERVKEKMKDDECSEGRTATVCVDRMREKSEEDIHKVNYENEEKRARG